MYSLQMENSGNLQIKSQELQQMSEVGQYKIKILFSRIDFQLSSCLESVSVFCQILSHDIT